MQRGEDDNLETDARDDYGIAFQEECLSNMCRAADLAGIGPKNNALDEYEFDIEEVAKELSLPDVLIIQVLCLSDNIVLTTS